MRIDRRHNSCIARCPQLGTFAQKAARVNAEVPASLDAFAVHPADTKDNIR